MAKFHIGPGGNPGECSAKSGNCPYGADAAHYGSKEEARAAFEASMGGHPAGKLRKTKESLALQSHIITPYHMNPSVVVEGDRFINDEGSVFEARESYDPTEGLVSLGVVDPETNKVIPGGNVKVDWNRGAGNRPDAFKLLDHKAAQDLRTISDAELGDRIASALNTAASNKAEGQPTPIRLINELSTAAKRRGKVTDNFIQRDGNGLWKAKAGLSSKPFRTYVDSTPGYSESRAIREVPDGVSRYETAAFGGVSYLDENGEPTTMRVIAPISGNITKTKRIELARQLWAFTGRDPQEFEDAGEQAQERFYNRHFSRMANVVVKRQNDTIDYDYAGGGGGGYDASSLKLVDLESR